MSSETIKLPFIDFSNLKPQTPIWESVKTQVRESLEEYGCFEAKLNQIPLRLRKSIFDGLEQLFDLSLQNKQLNVSDKPYHAYVGQDPMNPLYESLGIDDALSPGNIQGFTNLMWSEGNPTFSKNVESFTEQLSELDMTVRRMVVESLGLEKYMDEHINSTTYLVRVQKYDVPEQETELGLSSHTDKSICSILYQDEIGGLEVMTKDGQWFTVEPSLSSFVVMIGQSFQIWTNGRLHPPYHRVMMTGDETRYSIGMFSIPKFDYIIKPPEEMVDEDHPLLFKPIQFHDLQKLGNDLIFQDV